HPGGSGAQEILGVPRRSANVHSKRKSSPFAVINFVFITEHDVANSRRVPGIGKSGVQTGHRRRGTSALWEIWIKLMVNIAGKTGGSRRDRVRDNLRTGDHAHPYIQNRDRNRDVHMTSDPVGSVNGVLIYGKVYRVRSLDKIAHDARLRHRQSGLDGASWEA